MYRSGFLELLRLGRVRRHFLPVDCIQVSTITFQVVFILANPGQQFSLGKSPFSFPRRKCGWRDAFGRDFLAIPTRKHSIALDLTLLTEHAWMLLLLVLRKGQRWGLLRGRIGGGSNRHVCGHCDVVPRLVALYMLVTPQHRRRIQAGASLQAPRGPKVDRQLTLRDVL